MPRLTLPVSILLLLLFLFLLGQSYFEAKGRARRLELLEAEVGTLSDRKVGLEEELAYRQSPTYIEKEAREQSGYAFPNETIVVLPDFREGSSEALAKEDGETLAAETSAKEELPMRIFLFGKEIRIYIEEWGCLLALPASWTCP